MYRRADGSWSRGPYRDDRWFEPQHRSPLKAARFKADLTQQDLAAMLGVNRSQLAGYESGMRQVPLHWHPTGRAIAEFIEAAEAGGAALADWLAGYRGR